MRTGGHGNDSLIILIPFGVLVAVGTILFGGPSETLEVINRVVGDIARDTMRLLSVLFS
jgi:hypothetical protein